MEKLNIFLIFPASDDEILALGDDVNKYKEIVEDLDRIKQLIGNEYQFFYEAKNISAFCTKATQLIKGEYLGNIKTQLQRLLNKRAANVSEQPLSQSDCCYFQWNDSTICISKEHILSSATEKYIVEKEQTIVISFLCGDPWNRGVLPMIKDAPHHPELPVISNIPYFNPVGTFVEWYKARTAHRTISLSDVTKFERTKKIWERTGQRIYKERETGRYWYYDFYHKDNKEHYEVFDSRGDHLGEADTNGHLDMLKKDNSKSIHSILS